jgi:hypothetical protein
MRPAGCNDKASWHRADSVLSRLAQTATGAAGGSWIIADDLLSALNRYSIAIGDRDWSQVPHAEARRRESQEKVAERVRGAYDERAQQVDRLRVKSLLGR